MTPVPKTCETCAHRFGSLNFAKCSASGYYVSVERKHPSVCGKDFDAWVPRQGVLTRIKQVIFGVKAKEGENK